MSRFIYIQWILARYRMDDIVPSLRWVKLLRVISPTSWKNPYRSYSKGERLRLALEALGPIFIKAGQILSTRRDWLPEEIANELAKLQDQVPPFPGLKAKQFIEETLKLPIDAVFSEFDLNALASASIAQVHAATLLNGDSVVVKVLRPDIQKQINRDLDLLKWMARLLQRFSSKSRAFKPIEIVAEIQQTLQDELDLMREASNASQLKRYAEKDAYVVIPKIYWEYTHSSMIVMERIVGIPIYQIQTLKATNVSLKKLAERCVELFFTQAFRDQFFHADLHPGNLFVSVNHPAEPRLMLVDFGIVGSLNSRDQRYLAENLLALFKRNYQRVAVLHVECGWLPNETRIDQFEGAIRAVCEPLFERPLKEVSLGQLLMRLFQTARRFNINIQPQFILLQKTLMNVESLSRQLYPEIDLWKTATPYLEKWLKQQLGFKKILKRMRESLPYLSDKIPEIMERLDEWLKRNDSLSKSTITR